VRILLTLLFAARVAFAADVVAPSVPASLQRGYSQAYNLNFEAAQREFAGWQREHPQDPVGPASEAAGLLFAEFDRLGVLESQFFIKDSAFQSRPKVTPDPTVKSRFEAALARAESASRQALANDGKNHDALFTMTLVYGLRANYAALIEKRNVGALGYTRQASDWGEKLVKAAPDYYDGYLASGISKYIIGSLAAPVRWFLRLGGYSGDKRAGIQELEVAAQKGRYLGPFARLLLAVAYLRQNDRVRARELLAGLQTDFPQNPLFPRELARLDAAH
jgi:hypothetical protein